MTHFYNEFEPYPAQWLRNLMAAGHIPNGVVDERDIRRIGPEDVRGYTQCHFFAGIAGWPLALNLAGWPTDRPVWTGSCPCQPFSAAGQRKGTADDRHLWPEFLRLIESCKPPAVFGEQVASSDGRVWLSGVRTDLEALGYEVGAADLCAAGVSAPHIRQRLFWMADTNGQRFQGGQEQDERTVQSGKQASRRSDTVRCGSVVGMGDSSSQQVGKPGQSWEHWHVVDCGDQKRRRFEPSAFPLAHGVPNRVGRLRAYGNAIVPTLAAEFIRAFMEATPLSPILASPAKEARL